VLVNHNICEWYSLPLENPSEFVSICTLFRFKRLRWQTIAMGSFDHFIKVGRYWAWIQFRLRLFETRPPHTSIHLFWRTTAAEDWLRQWYGNIQGHAKALDDGLWSFRSLQGSAAMLASSSSSWTSHRVVYSSPTISFLLLCYFSCQSKNWQRTWPMKYVIHI